MNHTPERRYRFLRPSDPPGSDSKTHPGFVLIPRIVVVDLGKGLYRSSLNPEWVRAPYALRDIVRTKKSS